MLFHEFLYLTYNYDSLINYLFNKEIIQHEIKCPKYENVLHYQVEGIRLMFHCTKTYYKQLHKRKRQKLTCNFTSSVLQGTWFENFRFGFPKTCRFIGYFLMIKPRVKFMQQELQCNTATVVDWTNYCREIILFFVLYMHM